MPSASLLQMMQNAGVVNSRPNGTFGTGAAGVAAPRPATLSGGALPAAQQPSSQLRFMQAVPAQPQLAGYGLPAGQAQVPRPATTFAPLPASRSGPVTFRPPIYASSVANRPPSAQPMGTVSPALLSMSGQGAKKADVIDLTGDTDVVPSARAQPSALPSTEEVVYGVVRTKVRNVVWDAYLTADAPATNEEPVFVMQNPDQKTTLLVNNIVGVKVGRAAGFSRGCHCLTKSTVAFPARNDRGAHCSLYCADPSL